MSSAVFQKNNNRPHSCFYFPFQILHLKLTKLQRLPCPPGGNAWNCRNSFQRKKPVQHIAEGSSYMHSTNTYQVLKKVRC